MSRTLERKKQRREYLKRKGKAYVTLVTMSGTFLMALALVFCCIGSIVGFYFAAKILNGSAGFFVTLSLLTAVMAIFQGRLMWLSGRAAKVSRQELRIPHVPPVTLDTLPAEEILVRGSEEPQQAQKQVLVRPASREEETPAQELLRSSQEGLG